jgi:hypothetical protein
MSSFALRKNSIASSETSTLRRSRKWRHILIISLTQFLFLLSIAQLFLGVLLFNYAVIPTGITVGEVLILVAAAATVLQGALYLYLCHRGHALNGRRNKHCFMQNLFYWLSLCLCTIWWLAFLLGFYIFAKGLSNCQVEQPNSLVRLGSPCTIYEVSVGGCLLAM